MSAKEKKPKLPSELPIKDLLEISEGLNPDHFLKVYGTVKRDSFILNRHRSDVGCNQFIDLQGLRHKLADYLDETVLFDNWGHAIRQGKLGQREHQLRGAWRTWEYLNRRSLPHDDPDRLPEGKDTKDIAEAAALLKICREEITKMQKIIKEADQQTAKEERAKRKAVGAYKRNPDGTIRQVDGMEVRDGKILETGEDARAYLKRIAAEREERTRRRYQATGN